MKGCFIQHDFQFSESDDTKLCQVIISISPMVITYHQKVYYPDRTLTEQRLYNAFYKMRTGEILISLSVHFLCQVYLYKHILPNPSSLISNSERLLHSRIDQCLKSDDTNYKMRLQIIFDKLHAEKISLYA